MRPVPAHFSIHALLAPALATALTMTLIASPAAAQRTLYVTNASGSTIAARTIDKPTGALSLVSGSPYTAGGGTPLGVVVSPSGNHLYTGNANGHNVSAFSINQSTGALTAVAGSPFASGGNGTSGIAINPSGTRLYATNDTGGSVSAFSINQSTGALTAIAGSPFAAGTLPEGIAIDPAGTHLFVANINSDNISVYDINQSTGVLTPVSGSPFAAGDAPLGLTVNPAGTRLFVPNRSSDNIGVYDINQSTGALTPVSGSPFAAASAPRRIATNPTGTHLFAATGSTNDIRAYAIDQSTGALTPIAGSPFAAGTFPMSVSLDPTGSYLYASNLSSSNVSAYDVDQSTGALTSLAGSPFTGFSGPNILSTAITPDQPPTASLTADGQQAGQDSSFDASASTDPDGTVEQFDWDFGDGTTLTDGGATPTHTYAAGGEYTVRLTVTDDEGCSTELIWQGQSAYCNGSAVATTTQQVTIAAAPAPPTTPPSTTPTPLTLTLEDLVVRPGHFKVDPRGAVASAPISKGARVDFTLSAAATVKFDLDKRRPGRIVRGRCVKPRRGNRANRRCGIAYVSAGSFSIPGRAGANVFDFSGRLPSGSLEPGVYRISGRATSGLSASNTATTKFKITCPDKPDVCFTR